MFLMSFCLFLSLALMFFMSLCLLHLTLLCFLCLYVFSNSNPYVFYVFMSPPTHALMFFMSLCLLTPFCPLFCFFCHKKNIKSLARSHIFPNFAVS